MNARPAGYPFSAVIETYRSWGEDPGLRACLKGQRPGGFAGFVRFVLHLKMLPLYDFLGAYEQGLRVGRKALEEAGATGLALGRAQALLALGWMHYGTSEFILMEQVAQEALEIFSSYGEPGGQATALRQLGIVHNELGNREKSRDYYQQALMLYEGLDDRLGQALFDIFRLHLVAGAHGQLDAIEAQPMYEFPQLRQGGCLPGLGKNRERDRLFAHYPAFQLFNAGNTSLINISSVVKLGNPPQSTMKELTPRSMKSRICSMTCLGVPTKSKSSSRLSAR